MSVRTHEVETPEAPGPAPAIRGNPFERALGALLLIGGAAATIWAIPTVPRYPMAVAVALSVTAIGAGVVWQRSWSASGMFCLGLLLCSGSVGYLLVQGPSPFSFAWFFVPGAYLIVVGLRGLVESRRQRA